MRNPKARPWLLLLCGILCACDSKPKQNASPVAEAAGDDVILTVGSVSVRQADLEHHIREHYSGRQDEMVRKNAVNQLAERARLVQLALDEKLMEDTFIRAELGRLLSSRIRERKLNPKLQEIASTEIPEARLRDLYTANLARYQSNEKRQVAVLWLNPGKDPERQKQYIEKLKSARDWFSQNEDLKNQPEQGFSTLAVDFSEHQASRYKNGIVGWMESGSGPDSWTNAVSQIAFSLPEPGAVSEVVANLDGVFLVRYVSHQPAITRSFESVRNDLARDEKQRMKQNAESDFISALDTTYPVRWLKP